MNAATQSSDASTRKCKGAGVRTSAWNRTIPRLTTWMPKSLVIGEVCDIRRSRRAKHLGTPALSMCDDNERFRESIGLSLQQRYLAVGRSLPRGLVAGACQG